MLSESNDVAQPISNPKNILGFKKNNNAILYNNDQSLYVFYSVNDDNQIQRWIHEIFNWKMRHIFIGSKSAISKIIVHFKFQVV